MTIARLVITAVVLEGRTQADAARSYGVSKGWVSKLIHRYLLEGEAAFEPRSRRPHHTPNEIPASTVELIRQLRLDLTAAGMDAGPHTIAWHLQQQHITVSTATIWRTLNRAGLITPETQEETEEYLYSLPSRATQRDLAIRLHSLAIGRRHRY